MGKQKIRAVKFYMRRSGINIIKELLKLVSPLYLVMLAAISTGVLGFLDSIFLMVVGVYGLLGEFGFNVAFSRRETIVLLLILGVMRGILRYLEQYSNHYVAFKILAIIRDKVFKALRRLSPAKLEGQEKGNLISVITSDIELLEVFYAHTISPIAIAFIVSLLMVIYLGSFNIIYGLVGLLAYSTVGILVPMINSHLGKNEGMDYRNKVGDMNTYLLDSLRGLREVIQYDEGDKRLREMKNQTSDLYLIQGRLGKLESLATVLSDISVYIFSLAILGTGLYLYSKGRVDAVGVVMPLVIMMSSFGPVIALANLSNNLFHTFAAGERVLDILEEDAVVADVHDGVDIDFEYMTMENLDFSYGQGEILKDINLEFKKGSILGISGKSGSGKSTLLKLMMRFWDRDSGVLEINKEDIKNINTSSLRDNQSYVTQETQLFNLSIMDNIKIAKLNASDGEVVRACKKASIDKFIEGLPDGYDTRLGELGDKLSGGEKQRIGLARAFLHDSELILLDEPTSNLDSLNEAIILKALKEEAEDKTVVLVSHRNSTLAIADSKYHMESERVS